MLNLIAITNRGLAKQNYWDQVTKIASTDVDGLILREKDLDPEDYLTYAKKAQKSVTVTARSASSITLAALASSFTSPVSNALWNI